MAGTAGKTRILLAEDSALSRRLAVKMIEHCGYEADSAEDGLQAVDKACSGAYDLILMDMFMPGMNGGDAAEELIRKGVSTPIIALSGDVISKEELSRYGMKDSILKPLSEPELSRVVSAYCTARTSCQAETANPASGHELDIQSNGIFDEKSALEFSGGNREMMLEMLSIFAVSTRKNIDRLESEINAGDAQKAKSTSHLIKGEAKSLGALKVFRTATDINEAAKAGNLTRCPGLIPMLRSAFKEFSDHLDNYR